jgi:hypothetical protein
MVLNNIVTQFSGKQNRAQGQNPLLKRVSKKRLELFLRKLANLPIDSAAINDLKRKFSEFLPDFPMTSEIAQLTTEASPRAMAKIYSPEAVAKITQQRLVGSLSTAIRQAWAAPDAETRDWKMFILRRRILSFFYAEDKWPVDPPPLTPLDQALRLLQMQGRRAQVCGNTDCIAPFFWTTRRNQKFCGPHCATPARLEAQRRWWNEKGSKKPRRKKRVKS